MNLIKNKYPKATYQELSDYVYNAYQIELSAQDIQLSDIIEQEQEDYELKLKHL